MPTRPHDDDDDEPHGGTPDEPAQPTTRKSQSRPQTTGLPGALPPTEKPVPNKRRTTKYVVSVDDTTGDVIKIEKTDPKTGELRELTPKEYAAAYSSAAYAAPYSSGATAALLSDPLNSPAMQAYVRGVVDYLRAITDYR